MSFNITIRDNVWTEVFIEIIKKYIAVGEDIAKNFANYLAYENVVYHKVLVLGQNQAILKMIKDNPEDIIKKRDSLLKKFLLLK